MNLYGALNDKYFCQAKSLRVDTTVIAARVINSNLWEGWNAYLVVKNELINMGVECVERL